MTPFVRNRLLAQAAMVVGLIFSACTAVAAAPIDPALQSAGSAHQSLRIVAFGSSSTEGIGATSPAKSYPAQLQAVLAQSMPHGAAIEVVNRGIGGEDVDDMVKRLDKDVIAAKPEIVIWQTGSNDPMRNVPVDRFVAETRAGVQAMQKAGLQVIMMEPQWCPRLDATGDVDLFRDAIRKVAAEFNLTVIHRGDMMRRWVSEGRMTRTQMLAADGLHMSDLGYAELARAIAPEILRTSAVRAAVQIIPASR